MAGVVTVYEEVRAERERAHAKHGDTSMEAFPVDDMNRLAILTEEVGEVAKEFNEARHRNGSVDLAALRKELIQTAAMATAWADAIRTCPQCGGQGWTAEHHDGCRGDCSGICPVQVQCGWCHATGYELAPLVTVPTKGANDDDPF